MPDKTIVIPDGLPKPIGYNYAIAVTGGTTVYLAGQTAMDEAGEIVAPHDIVGQFERALGNLEVTVQASGGQMTDIVKMNFFVTDVDAYKAKLKEIGAVYRATFGKHFPAITLVGVAALFDPAALIEIEGVAVIGA